MQSCTSASHEALKKSKEWRYLPVAYVEAFPDEGYALMAKNCPHCRSTLAVEVPLKKGR